MRTPLVLSLPVILALVGCRSPYKDDVGDGGGDTATGDDGGTDDGGTDDGTDDGTDSGDGPVDADGDGFTADADCDDTDAAINPDAAEVCDGIDNDCDGAADDDDPDVTDPATWYADADADGYGTDAYTLQACAQPDGYAAEAGDCDDTDTAYNPGAAEDDCADPADYNCDGYAAYEDADGDGYAGCEECDDSSASNYPGATEYCDEVDNDCDGEIDEDDAVDVSTWYVDGDADGYGDGDYATAACEAPSGYVDNDEDCDDTDVHVNPDAVEVCDEVDNDCNGSVDGSDATDLATWYADADADGFGSATYTVDACDAPSGYTDDSSDCDDGDGDINPDATEVCDEVDNDCDGDVDESSAADADTWYIDSDGDGYGDGDTLTLSCDAPSGYVSNEEDCDDGDADISPAATEVCDEVDNDCDGLVDDDDTETPYDAGTFYADGDGDGYGDSAISTTTCEAPSGYVEDATDCDDDDPDTNPGATEVCDDVDNDCNGSTDDGATDTLTWYADSDGDGFGDADATTDSCDAPSGYTDDTSDCDDGDADINPDATEECSDDVDNDCDGDIDEECPVEHCGTIDADEVWEDNGVGHIITCTVYVSGSAAPVVTIEEGATVYFEENTAMYVGYPSYGDLVVEGGTDGVTMTSYADSPEAGDYYGLYVWNNSSSTTEFDGLHMEYGGISYGNLYLYYSDVPITNSSFTQSGTYGIFSNSSEPTITDTELSDNVGEGFYCYNSTCIDDAADSFSGNTLTGNGSYPIRLYAHQVGALAEDNSFSGNDRDAIQIVSGTVTEDTTWHAHDVPYFADYQLYVQHASNNPTLTLEDGVEIQVDEDMWFAVGTGTYGNLVVEGGTEGVTMTSAESSPAAGDWYGLYLGYYSDSDTIIDGLTVEYGGGNGTYSGDVFMYYTQSDGPTITDSLFRYSDGHGIYAYGTTEPTITGSTFSDNELSGIYLYASATLADAFTDNVLTDNGDHPIAVYSNTVGMLDDSSSYSGNGEDTVLVHGGVISENADILDLGVPYEVSADMYVYNAGGPLVTIHDGVEMYFHENAGLYVGNSSYGDLVVDGDRTSGEGVLFSAAEDEAAGSWDGLYLGYYSTEDTVLSGFTVEYAGHSTYVGGIYTYNAEATLSDCVIADNAYYGIYDYSSSELSISDCQISGTVAYGSNDGNGVDVTELAWWSNNTVTDNDGYPVVIPGDEMVELDDDSTYSGNGRDYVLVDTYYARTSGTWPSMDVPFLVDNSWGYLNVYGTAAAGVDIVADDVEIELAEDHILYIGWSSYADITADGLFVSSSEDSPAAGDWDSVRLGYYTEGSSITNSLFEYGGGNASYPAAVYCYYCTAEISDSEVADSSYYGVYAQGTYDLTLSGMTYTNMGSGDTYPTSL